MIKFNRIIAIELSLIFLLWLASIWVSHPYFDRPLDAHHEWDMAHVLVSMRAYNEWGFWKLMGASVFLPHTREWLGTDIPQKSVEINRIIASATKASNMAVYLSSPSWYIIFPYLIWKLINLIPFINVPLSAFYLQCVQLIISRLFTGIILYYLFLEIIKIFIADEDKMHMQRALAFLGVTAWMLNPAVLYFTQNTFNGEKSFLGFIFAVFLMAVKCRFRFDALSKSGKTLLLILSFIVCGTTYYGWLSLAVIGLIVLIGDFFSRRSPANASLPRSYVKTILPMAAGAFAAWITFVAQLLYYRDGFRQLFERFSFRTGAVYSSADPNVQLSIADVFHKITSYWDDFFPFGVIYGHEFSLGVIFLALAVIAYILLAAKTKDKMFSLSVFCVIYILPACYILFLKQWSYVHDYSALLMSFPIVFGWVILPVLLAHRYKMTNYSMIFIALLVLFSASQSRNLSVQFAGNGSNIYREMGDIVARNAGQNNIMIALPIHSVPKEVVELSRKQANWTFLLMSPQAIWYADRYIYKIDLLRKLISDGILDIHIIKKMDPILIAFNANEKLDEQSAGILKKNKLETKEELGGLPVFLYHMKVVYK
jgi:hypothetical protein